MVYGHFKVFNVNMSREGKKKRGPRKPVSCSDLAHKVSMSRGNKHTCGVKSPGATEARSWQGNYQGRLAHLSLHLSLELFSVLHGKDFVAEAAFRSGRRCCVRSLSIYQRATSAKQLKPHQSHRSPPKATPGVCLGEPTHSSLMQSCASRVIC